MCLWGIDGARFTFLEAADQLPTHEVFPDYSERPYSDLQILRCSDSSERPCCAGIVSKFSTAPQGWDAIVRNDPVRLAAETGYSQSPNQNSCPRRPLGRRGGATYQDIHIRDAHGRPEFLHNTC
ncbi:unnamed protein product [Ostreobium quekettii]|uniref:Uncharacterized protein n=1 Tax=Ostreobium quekettii TaxID=121088 RepID=A0A8S1JH63_9CHLO|nr:unnamed protein product [Ostreobium quekettii]